jgi:Cu-Zn family superoxide dismutase
LSREEAIVNRIVVSLLCAAALAGTASAQQPLTAKATFINPEGNEIGNATLTETPTGVLISVDLKGLSTGQHAFHIHEKGVCNPADKFTSAGGHFNVHDKKHGYLVEGGPHAGDMPNLVVADDGHVGANVFNTAVTLKDGPNSLFGPNGTALVIHDRGDDYKSQPAGDAGSRIACAVIKR